ncbi:Digestive organ expansion factor-like protein [Hypsibius exemplaris]|uniref:U3 small nucleolar RNA-associated protein 25 homolog n=1 Tax=Hypsibius exemplaris TaxID=2072580 RepID=A0A1W0WMS5_HYPEX|nr:Digestive organ expansion factor-like protein [Hypsibius exemplaris]
MVGKRKFRNASATGPKPKRKEWNKRRAPLKRQAEPVENSENSSADDGTSSDVDVLDGDLNDGTVPAVRLLAATFDGQAGEDGGKVSADQSHAKLSKRKSGPREQDLKSSAVYVALDIALTDDALNEATEADEEEALGEPSSSDDPFVMHLEKILTEDEADAARNKKLPSAGVDVSLPHLGTFTLKSSATAALDNPSGLADRPVQKSHVKMSLLKHLKAAKTQPWTAHCAESFAVMNTYRDLFHFEKDHRLDMDMKRAYCLHALNHVLKARNRVVAHNAKLTRGTAHEASDFKDQGFTRPKVLIIAPFKHDALRIYEILAELLTGNEDMQVMNKARFEKEFGWDEKDPVANSDRPEDFRATFTGNTDDCFRVGISFTKKTLKMYTEFYSADIIIASPLGLRMIIGTEGEKQHEYDFLSSIEILVMDQADIFMMQNWEHVTLIMKHLHLQPKSTGKLDFGRVRHWVLNGWSQLYRQTIFLSAFRCPEFQALANRHCSNYEGAFWQKGSSSHTLSSVVVPIPHCFHRIPGNDIASMSDARFNYFRDKILPQLNDPSKTQAMIFIPSYFDFVRIRNHFHREEISFVQICEYTSTSKIARARDLFYHGKKHFLLYTERFHFYRRYRIKGIRHILFYDLPHYPHFYPELCNMMTRGEETAFHQFTSDALFSKFDSLSLAPIVGIAKMPAMLQPDKAVHMFVTSPADGS